MTGSTWQPISTAPKNAKSIRVLMKDGTIHEDAHWAQDLSGEDQPPFIGWFIPRSKEHPEFGYVGIEAPKSWMPMLSNAERHAPSGAR